MKQIIKVKNLVRTFYNKAVETRVLRGLDLEVAEGEFVAIMGKSGAGKSTLLYQMSLLDHPTSGEVNFDGLDTEKLSHDERTQIRLFQMGYVFQDYALIPELTAVENVMMPILMQGKNISEAKILAIDILEKVELEHRLNNLPSQLSGGEQQRCAIARAVAHNPKVLFADEPTANLDTVSGNAVLDLFKELNDKGQTIVMVTHEDEYTKYCNRIIQIEDGQIVKEKKK